MPKATPSKADLPKKPAKPRLVQDAALFAQRMQQYDADMAIYEAAMADYAKGKKAREAAKAVVKRKAAAEEEGGAKKAPRSSAPVPRSNASSPRSQARSSVSSKSSASSKKPLKPRQLLKASPRARPKQPAAPQPTSRQLAEAVIPGNGSWISEHPIPKIHNAKTLQKQFRN